MKFKGYIKKEGAWYYVRPWDYTNKFENTEILKKIYKESKNADKIYNIKFENKNKRTLPQNSYYWGVVIELICKNTGDDPLSLHEDLKKTFLGIIMDKGLKKTISTSSITKIEFMEYISQIKHWAYNWLGIIIPEAKEYN